LSISGAQTPNVDLTSFDGASSAITTLDASLRSVNDQRATLGATMNRLRSTLGNIDTNVDAVLASRSRIQDADVANESAQRARQEVLARGTIAILAQANIIPGVANRLLGA
jgi:flagellin